MDKTKEVLNKIQDALQDAQVKASDAVLNAYGGSAGYYDSNPAVKEIRVSPKADPAELRQARCDRVFKAVMHEGIAVTSIQYMAVANVRRLTDEIADALYKAGMFR